MEDKIAMVEEKTITYTYLFNYFGKDTFKGKTISGASVEVAIRPYKNGKEVKFTEEPKCINRYYYSDIFKVSFDRKNIFNVRRNLKCDNLYRIKYGWEKVDYEVIGFSLDYYDEWTDEEKKELPNHVTKLPISYPMEVFENEFREFLSNHIEDFDISDNENAQVPSYSFI